MGKREKFNETSLPDKKIFYSKLNLKVNLLVKTMRKDYAHAKKVFKELKLKNLGDYHDLYI